VAKKPLHVGLPDFSSRLGRGGGEISKLLANAGKPWSGAGMVVVMVQNNPEPMQSFGVFTV
jgi:hypothetical protein